MSESSAAMMLSTAYLSRLLILGMAGLLVSAIIWSGWTELDEITRGVGKVIPSSRLQVIQNLEGGIVESIFIEEGDEVKSGQPLLELDDTQFASNYREKELDYFNNLARALRLKADLKHSESLEFPSILDEYANYRKREQQLFKNRRNAHKAELSVMKQQQLQAEQELISIQAQLKVFKKNHQLSKQEFKMTLPLAEKGVVSKVQLMRLEQEVNRLASDKENAELAMPRMESAIDEIEDRMNEVVLKYRTKTLEALKEVEAVLDQLEEARKSLGDRVSRTIIRSPVNGIVQKLYINTLSGVVDPGMDLVDIIPVGDSLEVEMMVHPRDIAFIRLGLKAVVKLTAYDFTIYGGLDGKVVHISADSIQNEKGESFYIVKIKTHKSHLSDFDKSLPIMSGMQAEVDIMTGKKSLLAYLMKPILRAKSRAFTER